MAKKRGSNKLPLSGEKKRRAKKKRQLPIFARTIVGV